MVYTTTNTIFPQTKPTKIKILKDDEKENCIDCKIFIVTSWSRIAVGIIEIIGILLTTVISDTINASAQRFSWKVRVKNFV